MSREVVADIVRVLRELINQEPQHELVDDLIDSQLDHFEEGELERFRYSENQFPPLERTQHLSMGSIETPQSVAEAYIWKHGYWDHYRKFVGWYYYPDAPAPEEHFVFYAFAKHLRNPNLAIFDQHALRALWGIADAIWNHPDDPPRQFLLKISETMWKSSGSGSLASLTYEIYSNELERIRTTFHVNMYAFDKLLMCLGRALKHYSRTLTAGNTHHYGEFCDIIDRGGRPYLGRR